MYCAFLTCGPRSQFQSSLPSNIDPAAGTAKVGEPAKAADNAGAESAGKAEIKVVCHDKVKDGKPVMKDGKPEQECKKIKVHKKLEAHDIPPAKK